jgi:hypothetical protein
MTEYDVLKSHKSSKLHVICISSKNVRHLVTKGDRGGAVVKVLRYKKVGRWFDPRWCHWNFSLT